MGRLFGTDGVRGVANKELTGELAFSIGKAAARVLASKTKDGKRPLILIGKDTRISGDMLENALAAGFNSVGADVQLIGVVPTPAVAYLVSELKADAGAMISASHNPFEYNGIKLFSGEGYKLPDAVEEEIEAIILDNKDADFSIPHASIGVTTRNTDAVELYIKHVAETVSIDFAGKKIAMDCANGSASVTAEKIFKLLNADVTVIGAEPNGININDGCGSTALGLLQNTVREGKYDVGLAFDGDADRFLAIDENGELIDGDKIIALFALALKEQGKLSNNTAVVTSMTNMGFYEFAKNNGINVAVTAVGDRYVLEEMLNKNYGIGGEQSGHIIFLEYATTGDGQLSAVQFMQALIKSGKVASEFAAVMEKYPQIMINLKANADQKKLLSTNEEVKKAISDATEKLGDEGRIVVRPSGTEPVVRVMLEGKDINVITEIGNAVCDAICEKTGATR